MTEWGFVGYSVRVDSRQTARETTAGSPRAVRERGGVREFHYKDKIMQYSRGLVGPSTGDVGFQLTASVFTIQNWA